MNPNSNSRATSQIVYTSVDDDMSVTEIICEYGDADETAPEAVCEVEAPDLTQSHVYIEDSSDRTPIVREEKIYIDTTDVLHPNQSLKQEEIYIEDGMGASLHQIFAEDKKFKCGVCSEQFDDLPTISRHMEEHSGEKKYECAECGKQFKNINNVMRHMVVHSGERKYMCPSCNKPFTQIGNLKRHMQIHSGEKKYPCSVCGKSFTQMNNLIRHQAIHSGQKNFECPMCHRLFNQVSNLNRHVLIHKGIKMFKCEVCGRAFSQLINLQKHKERHMRDKKYKCNECNLGFDHKLAFNKHLEVHYGKPRYQCNVCGRVVTQKSTLNQHMLLHDEDKQYNCRQCHKAYAQKGSLSKHLEAHNNVRHHCKVCNRYFYDEKGLWKHESTHTDKAKSIAGFVEKEMKLPDYELQFCEICGRSFILKRSLKKHMAKAHAISVEGKKKLLIEEHPCELCGKVFVHRKSLKKHAYKKHGVTIEYNPEKLKFVSGIEKENQGIDITEENEDGANTEDLSANILNKAEIAEALLQIKQENVIEADTSLEDGENVWKNFTCFKVKEEPVARETSDSAVHLCRICGRGYYLINNLRKHMAVKHGIALEKESEEGAEKETGTELENEANVMQTDSIRKEKDGKLNERVNDEHTCFKPIQLIKIQREDEVASEEKRGRGKKRKDLGGPDDSCRICGKDFQSSVDLLLHMLHHSKDKKDDLLNVVNEAAQEFQNMKKSEADLSVTEKTKGLVSHFRKCSRSQSAVITSVFSISEKHQETFSARIASSSTNNSNKQSLEESIVSECLDEEDLEGENEEIIEIDEVEDDLNGSMPSLS